MTVKKPNTYVAPSLTDLIIATLFSYRSSYTFKKLISDRKFKKHKENNIRVTLSKLHSKGYIDRSKLGWYLTQKGKEKNKEIYLFGYIPSPFKNKQNNNTIIAFDIPEKNKRTRNWLRNQIKIFGYSLLQKSLWIGPGPLPESFLKRLEDLNIRKNVKMFRINNTKN